SFMLSLRRRPTLFPYTTLFRSLLMALGAIVIIGVLVGGVVFVSTQDYRIGGNTVRQTRAAAAAELGLNRVPQDWNLANNQRPVADRKSTRLNSRHLVISHAVRC